MAWSPNTPGSDGSTDLGAFLRVFSGETVAAYNKATLIKDKLRSRNITSGKSATFPTISTSSAKLHTPGDDLFTAGSGNTYKPSITNNEKIIQINKLLIDTSFVDNLDEMMNHFDARSEYASQMGAALAVAGDKWSLGALTRGSGTTLTATGTYANAIAGTTAGNAVIKEGLKAAANSMDVAGVPKDGRYAVLSPLSFYGFMEDDAVMSSDYGSGGNRATGDVGKLHYLGFELISSAIWSDGFMGAAGTTEETTEVLYGLNGRATYDVVLTKVYGVAFHSAAAGVVSLKGMTTETDWIPERQGNLIVCKQAIGIDILRPTSSILLKGA